MSVVRKAGLVLLLLLLLLFGAAAFLLATEPGARLLYAGAKPLIPGELSIDRINGRLLGALELKGIRFQSEDTQVQVDRIDFAWQPSKLLDKTVQIDKLHIDGIELDLPPPPEEEEQETELPDIELPVEVHLEDIRVSDVSVALSEDQPPFIVDEAILKADYTGNVVDIHTLRVRSPLFEAEAVGSLRPQGSYPLDLKVAWTITPQGFAPVTGAGAMSGELKKRLALSHQVSSPFEAELKAAIDEALTDDLRWDARLQVRDFKARELSEELLQAQVSAEVITQGALDGYRVYLEADIAGAGIPAGRWTIDASGNQNLLALNTLQGETLDGILKVTGEVAWQPAVTWQFAIEGQEINPSAAWPEWPGRLAFEAGSQGRRDEQGTLRAEVDIKRMDGMLRGYPVNAQTEIKIDGDHYSVPRLEFSSGSAELSAAGDIRERWDLRWRLDVPDLDSVLAGGSGSLRSEGIISGARSTPQVSSFISAEALAYRDYQVAKLEAVAELDPLGNSDSTLKLEAEDLQLGAQQVGRVALQGQGNPDRHQLSASVDTPEEHLELALNGAWAEGQQSWDGQLTQLLLQSADFGEWRLAQPVPIQASHEAARVGRLCWVGDGRLCVQGSWQQAGAVAADVSLRDIPLALSMPFLPQGMALDGTLGGDVSARYSATGVLAGEAVLNVSPGSVTYAAAGGEPVMIEYAGGRLLQARAGKAGARAGLDLNLTELGDIAASISLPQFNHAIAARAQQPVQGKLHARFDELGIVSRLVPDLEQLQGLIEVNLDLDGSLSQPLIRAEADIEGVRGVWQDTPVDLAGEIRAALDGDRYRVSRLELRSGSAHLLAEGELQESWDARWRLDAADLGTVYPAAQGSLSSQGEISGPRAAPQVSSFITAQGLAYRDYRLAALELLAELDLQGNLDSELKLEASGLQFGEQVVERIAVQGAGNAERHQLSASVKTPQDRLELALAGTWDERMWDGELAQLLLQSGDFGQWKLAAPVPIRASAQAARLGQLCWIGEGRLCARGSWEQAGEAIAELSLRDVPLALAQPFLPEGVELADGATVIGDVAARYDDSGSFATRTDLTVGSIRLTAEGGLREDWDVNWRLEATSLSSVLADAGGGLRSEGTISGPRETPRIASTLTAQALTYQDYQLADLKALADLDLNGANRLEIEASDVQLGEQIVERIVLQGEGSAERHQLSAAVDIPKTRLELLLSGEWAERRQTWNGQFTQLLLQTTDFGEWRLAEPVPIQASAEAATLGQLCWLGKGRLCAQASWEQAGAIAAELALGSIPLALAQPFLPEGMALSGTLQGEVSGRYSEAGLIIGQAELDLSPGSLTYPVAEGDAAVINYQGGPLLRLTADAEGAEGMLNLGLVNLGSIAGSFSLPQFNAANTAPAQQAVGGRLRAQLNDLDMISGFVPELEELQGRVDINLNLDGSIAEPRLEGHARLTDGAATLVSAGIQVQDINFEAQSSGGDSLALTGGAQSGEGEIRLSGRISLNPDAGFPTTLQIEGERFEAVSIAAARVLVSPDLSVQKQGDRLEVTGEVLIPEATIEPRDLGGDGVEVVTVSQDVVIVDAEQQTERQEEGLEVYARVRVILGEDIDIDAFGFTGGIAGSILVIEEPQSVTTATGDLEIVDGEYTAYGQDLTIETGRIIFGGGPVDNPGLDVRAVREADDGVIAGVQVRGTVTEPELTLFSDPPMEEANTLSYLLLGRPLDQAGSGEGDLLLKAASSLGLKGGDALASRIGNTFGLDEVGVESESGLENSALVIGKYLSPRLYINYSRGLFSSSDTLGILYSLTDNLSISTEVGSESGTGADILYTIER